MPSLATVTLAESLATVVSLFEQQTNDDLCHLVCECNENRSYCGEDVSADPWDPFAQFEDTCALCVWVHDHGHHPCPLP